MCKFVIKEILFLDISYYRVSTLGILTKLKGFLDFGIESFKESLTFS